MEGQKAIVNKILDEATAISNNIALETSKKCDEKIIEATNWASEYTKAQNEILEQDIQNILLGKKLNAELEVKKAVLKAKRDVLEDVFDSAYNKLCKLDKASYLKLVNKLINEFADDGDEIVLSKDKVLSATDISIDKFTAKGLTVSKKFGEFIGGVMLIGKLSDKDLSFKALVENKKEMLTFMASKMLF